MLVTVSYDTINFKLENGNVEIKVKKCFVQRIGNNKIKVCMKNSTYVFEENSKILSEIVNYVTKDYEDIENFEEYFFETYFLRNELDNIFKDNNYFYKTFKEIFYPELDLNKE